MACWLAQLAVQGAATCARGLNCRWVSTCAPALAGIVPAQEEAIFSPEHVEMRGALRRLIDKEINPYVDEWEEAQIFPAHKVASKRVCVCVCVCV